VEINISRVRRYTAPPSFSTGSILLVQSHMASSSTVWWATSATLIMLPRIRPFGSI